MSQILLEARPVVHVERFDAETRDEISFDGLLLGMPESNEGRILPFVPGDRGRLKALAFEVVDDVLGFVLRIERPHLRHPY